jgi:hypothetical protein
MAKSNRGRAPRVRKPSLKLPQRLGTPGAPKPPKTPAPPRPSGPVGSVPGPDFKKVMKKLGKKKKR